MRIRPAGPVVLCILDGVGIGRGGPDDAVKSARTPTLDWLMSQGPARPLLAHGTHVGLPSDKDIGNSEVGHNAMGAGRIFDQGAKLIGRAIADGSVWKSKVWQALIQRNTVHLIGLVSDGNVHSHTDHLRALIDRAVTDGVARLRVHVLTDGRDVAVRSALSYIEPLEAQLAATGRDYRIASGGGRMHITMDRYGADWEMVERGWRCHVLGEGRPFRSASVAIKTLYDEDPEITDQDLAAFVVCDEGAPVGQIQDGDGVLLINFRGDRAIEISQAFDHPEFSAFPRPNKPDVFFAGIMEYDGDLHIPRQYLVSPPAIDNTVGEHLVRAGVRTLACSETQKFGHVTYFFNGNRSGRIDDSLERYVEIPSDRLPFQERPWMKAAEITDTVIAGLNEDYGHIRLNLANGDMVGHTGDLEATRIAVEAVDLQLQRLVRAVRRRRGVLVVTADHGNADEMWLRKGSEIAFDSAGKPQPLTAHTRHLVPFAIFDGQERQLRLSAQRASIGNVGATLLELCGVAPPEGYLPSLLADPN